MLSLLIDWDVAWTTDEVIDTLILAVSCVIVAAVPIFYAIHANLRDPLARAVIIGTAATAIAFNATLLLTIAVHAGWPPDETTGHWIARSLYVTVAFGKGLLLMALWVAVKAERRWKEQIRD